ncbi:MAG: transposase [Deltaproteobacteria bacterium]|nr:transposase [Deltaproteobacteria bacterium]
MAELTLLLLYLASWEEEPFRGAPTIHRAWKNHRFEILDALVEEGLLISTHRSKSVDFTAGGLARARALQGKYVGP